MVGEIRGHSFPKTSRPPHHPQHSRYLRDCSKLSVGLVYKVQDGIHCPRRVKVIG